MELWGYELGDAITILGSGADAIYDTLYQDDVFCF
jgi:hypothetical protein